jgi:hypothetical protein
MNKYTIEFLSHGTEEEAVNQISRGCLLADRSLSKRCLLLNAALHGSSNWPWPTISENGEMSLRTAKYALANLKLFHERSIGAIIAAKWGGVRNIDFMIVKVQKYGKK